MLSELIVKFFHGVPGDDGWVAFPLLEERKTIYLQERLESYDSSY